MPTTTPTPTPTTTPSLSPPPLPPTVVAKYGSGVAFVPSPHESTTLPERHSYPDGARLTFPPSGLGQFSRPTWILASRGTRAVLLSPPFIKGSL
ncbi:hypothetical protein FRC09_018619, partial [Ceratobasidium sp. 395]